VPRARDRDWQRKRQRRASNASRPDAPYAITRYLLPATAVDGACRRRHSSRGAPDE
jgi:hypothetical protein